MHKTTLIRIINTIYGRKYKSLTGAERNLFKILRDDGFVVLDKTETVLFSDVW